MIRKNKEQFDSGGIMLKHTFLLGFNDLNIKSAFAKYENLIIMF